MVARDSTGRWKPGNSGNPHGRPARKAFTDALIQQLDGSSDAQDIVQKVIELARQGERWAVELVWTRLEGRPWQGREAGPFDEMIASALSLGAEGADGHESTR